MKKIAIFSLVLVNVLSTQAQKKDVTIDDIWKNYSFYSRTVNGVRSLNNGVSYSSMEGVEKGSNIIKYSYTKKSNGEVLIDNSKLIYDEKVVPINDYDFSSDEKKVLISSNTEGIYRHSSKSDFFIYDIEGSKLVKLTDGEKQMYASFSSDADKVAYVQQNNLFYKNLKDGKIVQVTKDGKKGTIINGASDWVYEEELVLVKAFKWSPDGSKIAYYKFDESNVKEWSLKYYDNLYPTEERFKYPKAGEDNSKVEIYIYDLVSVKSEKANISGDFEYIIRMDWTNDSKSVMLQTMNRHQSNLKIDL